MRNRVYLFIALTVSLLCISCFRAEQPKPVDTGGKPALTADKEIRTAILAGDVYTVDYLLSKNEELAEIEDSDQNTLLHYAAWKGDIRIVKLLIEHKADVNAQNKWGFTVLHDLARREETNEVRDIASLLIRFGAKVNTVTNYGNTPLDIAEIKGHQELIRVLRQNGGKRSKHSLNLPPVPEFARNLK